MNSVSKARALAGFALAMTLVSGCHDYDPPPEVKLRQPEGGAFQPGDPLVLEFSEKIDRHTLSVSIWSDVRDEELEIPDDADPLIGECDLDASPCGDLTIAVAEDRMSATLNFDPEGLGAAGSPMILDILPGLEDRDGNDTGAHTYYDFQFRGGEYVNSEPVPFDDGVYIIVGSVSQPLPAVLTLISDVKVTDDGRFFLAGAEGDPTSNEVSKTTKDPNELMVDDSSLGWTAYVPGFIKYEDGQRLLETEPVQINLPLGPVIVQLDDVRVFGEIVKNEATGKDRIDGTLSWAALRLLSGDRETPYEGGTAAVSIDYVAPADAPSGHPVVCGDLCGAVTEGLCEPPDPYPTGDFCEVWAAENP